MIIIEKITQAITELVNHPTRSDRSNYAAVADIWCAAMEVCSTQFKNLVVQINTMIGQLNTVAGEMLGLRDDAQAAAKTAMANANSKGPWSGLTGSLDFPATAYHVGKNWQLLQNLADVTSVEPGTDTSVWVAVGDYTTTQDLGSPTGATIIDTSFGRIAKATITGDVQFTFSSDAPDGDADIILLKMCNPGSHTITWNDVIWDARTEPPWQAVGVDIAYFIRDDIGGKWRGLRLWKGVA